MVKVLHSKISELRLLNVIEPKFINDNTIFDSSILNIYFMEVDWKIWKLTSCH